MDKGDKQVLSDIEKFGWHVVIVSPEKEEPGFAFSIGMFKNYGHPEIIIFGLKNEVMHNVINSLGEDIKNGKKLATSIEYDNVLDETKCIFVEVEKKNYKEYLGYALWYYKNIEFPVLQCVWPSKTTGLFPWDKEVAQIVKDYQPALYKMKSC